MKISVSSRNVYCLLVFMTIGFTSIRLCIGGIFSYIGYEVVGKILFYIIYFLVFVFARRYVLSTISLNRVICFFAWIVYCLYSAITTDLDSEHYVDIIKYIAVFGGGYLIIGQSIRKQSWWLKDQIYKIPSLLNLFGILNYILLGRTGTRFSEGAVSADYSMELSYANLASAIICTIILLAGNFKDKELLNTIRIKQKGVILLFNSIISYVLVLIGGSRGPILVLVFVVFLSMIYSLVNRKNINIIILCFFISAFLVSFILLNSNLLSGTSIRLLSMISSGNALETSGREHYVEISLNAIRDNALSGVGVFHDRVYIYERFHRSYAINSTGSYPHNFFLEILVQYGIIVGGGILLFITNNIVRAYKEDMNTAPEVFLLMIGLGLLTLMISKTYTQTWEFYMLIGYLIESKKKTSTLNFPECKSVSC